MIAGYLYAAMWLLIAGYLFYLAIKGERIFFIIAPFFVFLGGWALADELTSVDLMGGVYGWIYRAAAIAALVACAVWYYTYRKKR